MEQNKKKAGQASTIIQQFSENEKGDAKWTLARAG